MRNTISCLALILVEAAVAQIVYVTDLPAFTQLAPCAASAVSYAINSLTYKQCAQDVTALASCVCTKDQNSAAVSADISSNVLSSCGATASEDVSSAAALLKNYCTQGPKANPFPAITNGVSQYITDLPAYSDLGPCASNALSYLIGSMTYSKCPGAASALVSCACLKNQNSLLISGDINKSVFSSCGTTHSQDVASAHAVFAGYCGLNNGTSNFPTPTPLAGSMTYYVTDMAEYSSLAPCAQSAVYYQAQYSLTYSNCQKDPLALASCACAKDSNSASVSTGIISDVKESCSTTASEDVTSALAVFGLYCSAANGVVNPKGITVSVKTTARVNGGSGTNYGGSKGGTTGPTETGSGAKATGGAASDTNKSGGEFVGKKGIPMAAIIGISVGAAILIGLIGFGGWKYRRNRLNKQSTTYNPNGFPPNYHGNDFGGKVELASTSVSPLPPKSAIYDKPALSPGVPPITQEKPSEMPAPPAIYRTGTPGTMNSAEVHQGYRPDYQAPGWGQQGPNAIEMHGRSRDPGHEMPGANMNSGPYYEMPGHHGWSR